MNDKDTYRMHTKVIQIGDRKIGGGNPIAIQSMTNTKTEDVKATVEQILRLEKAGCEIIRCTVPTLEAAAAIREIKKHTYQPRQYRKYGAGEGCGGCGEGAEYPHTCRCQQRLPGEAVNREIRWCDS